MKEPSMYRWVSSVRDVEGKKDMVIGFSVPLAALPRVPEVCFTVQADDFRIESVN